MNLKDRMRQANNTAYRPEQFRLQEFFRKNHPQVHTEMEYTVFSTDGLLIAKIDFADLDHKKAYRLDGGSHHNQVKDDLQKERLETRGWVVIDCKRDSYEWNWLWNE